MDAVKNFAKIVVSTGYDSSAVSVTLQAGDGAKLPTPATDGEYNLVWWNSTDHPDPTADANTEIVRCTARAGDVITVVRAQEETLASDKNLPDKKYKMILALTKKMMDDIDSELSSCLKALVEDETPQLGGNLDLQTNLLTGEGGTAGVYVNSAGNVGIGTTSPDAKVELLMDNPQLLFTDSNEAVDKKSFRVINVNQQMRLTARTDENLGNADAGDIMVWERDGNVGIGTINPLGLLHVSDGHDVGSDWQGDYDKFAFTGQDFQFSIVDTDTGFWGAQIALKQVDGTVYENSWGILRATNGDGTGDGSLRFTYGAHKNVYINDSLLTILPGGNVGIGTAAPTEKLDINSDTIRVRTAKTPATAGAPGNTGDIAWDADYIYICIATNSWHRAAHAAW